MHLWQWHCNFWCFLVEFWAPLERSCSFPIGKDIISPPMLMSGLVLDSLVNEFVAVSNNLWFLSGGMSTLIDDKKDSTLCILDLLRGVRLGFEFAGIEIESRLVFSLTWSIFFPQNILYWIEQSTWGSHFVQFLPVLYIHLSGQLEWSHWEGFLPPLP